jgi:cation:H+ antiporter
MLLALLTLLGGFIILVWSADRFVDASSATALNLGISPLVIGMTIMGFGTSAPEMLVSAMASLNGTPDIAVGNAIGSNIANIGLVLGITALVSPLVVHPRIFRQEVPILFGITFLAGLLLLDNRLDALDGFLLFSGLFLVTGWLIHCHRKHPEPTDLDSLPDQTSPLSSRQATLWLAIGLTGMLISSKLVVWSATLIAQTLGISDLVIGLTIIAIGTSLPELSASLMAIRKNEHDLALGNVLGSNLYNLLGVLPVPALLAPAVLSPHVLPRDYPIMALFTLLLIAMAYGLRKDEVKTISRLEGAILLSGFIAYMGILYIQGNSAS